MGKKGPGARGGRAAVSEWGPHTSKSNQSGAAESRGGAEGGSEGSGETAKVGLRVREKGHDIGEHGQTSCPISRFQSFSKEWQVCITVLGGKRECLNNDCSKVQGGT